MPAVLLGIPWLASMLISVFGGIVSFFATYIAKRFAIIIAVIAALVLLTAAFFTVLHGIGSGLVASGVGGTGWQIFIPPNLHAVLSLWLAAKLAYWVYTWNVRVVQLRLF